eukprot:6440372-Pyramimonas_sp.AAC.1
MFVCAARCLAGLQKLLAKIWQKDPAVRGTVILGWIRQICLDQTAYNSQRIAAGLDRIRQIWRLPFLLVANKKDATATDAVKQERLGPSGCQSS